MQVTIPLAICNADLPKECLTIYCWCVHLTELNEGKFQLDFNYLKKHTRYAVKKISMALNFLSKLRLIELTKVGSKQFCEAQEAPDGFQNTFDRLDDEYTNLLETKANLRQLNYVRPEDILSKNS